LLRAALALGETTNPSKGKAGTTENLPSCYSAADDMRTPADKYVSRTGKALLQSFVFISIE